MINPGLIFITASSEVENTNLFPFSLRMHIIFSLIALVFFVYMFSREKKPYQLIMAAAIPLSLTIWLSEDRKWFYILGVIELVLILAALVTSIIFRDKSEEKSGSDEQSEAESSDEAEEKAADPEEQSGEDEAQSADDADTEDEE